MTMKSKEDSNVSTGLLIVTIGTFIIWLLSILILLKVNFEIKADLKESDFYLVSQDSQVSHLPSQLGSVSFWESTNEVGSQDAIVQWFCQRSQRSQL